jgi:hypothetical protein
VRWGGDLGGLGGEGLSGGASRRRWWSGVEKMTMIGQTMGRRHRLPVRRGAWHSGGPCGGAGWTGGWSEVAVHGEPLTAEESGRCQLALGLATALLEDDTVWWLPSAHEDDSNWWLHAAVIDDAHRIGAVEDGDGNNVAMQSAIKRGGGEENRCNTPCT